MTIRNQSSRAARCGAHNFGTSGKAAHAWKTAMTLCWQLEAEAVGNGVSTVDRPQ